MPSVGLRIVINNEHKQKEVVEFMQPGPNTHQPQNFQPQHNPQHYPQHYPQQNYQQQTQQVHNQQYMAQPGAVVVHGQNPAAQVGAAAGVTVIVVIVVFAVLVVLSVVLYAWANSLADEAAYDVSITIGAEPTSGFRQIACDSTESVIDHGEYYACSFGLNGDGELDISVDVGNGASVDIYTMTESNYYRWIRGENFDYFDRLSSTNVHSEYLVGGLAGNQEYVVVIVNS